MSHILFFATKNDLLPILQLTESHAQLKYTRARTIKTPNPDVYLNALEIPNLGIASNESSICCDTYLVTFKGVQIRPRHISVKEIDMRYAFDQLYNPESITLTPGGLWKKDILLHGRVATASKHPTAVKLMKLYSSAFRKKFVKIESFYVGAEAKIALDQGKRLTMAEQSPPEFNLSKK